MLIYPIPTTHVCFRLIKTQMFCKFDPASLSCISHCTVAVKNIRNMHAVSTKQIAEILHFNDKLVYKCLSHAVRLLGLNFYLALRFITRTRRTCKKIRCCMCGTACK